MVGASRVHQIGKMKVPGVAVANPLLAVAAVHHRDGATATRDLANLTGPVLPATGK